MNSPRRNPDWYTDSSGETVDLNDPATYERGWFKEQLRQEKLRLDGNELRMAVHNAYAFSLYYTTILHPEWDRGQHRRVEGMARAFAREVREPDRWVNVEWLRKQLFLVLDETENQC